jgi:hypothetical protein
MQTSPFKFDLLFKPMRTSPFSFLFGLTATAAVLAPLASHAASFDFNKLKNISTRPITSNNTLDFFGLPSENQGFTAFFSLDPNAKDRGHTNISLNAPKGPNDDGNPYYTTGRPGSPIPSGATRSGSLDEGKGFTNFFNYLTDNNISLDEVGLSYGQKSDRDFSKTWNLGEDKLGQDWFASPTSNVEERIYQANPDDVEFYLSLGDTKIVDFGYSDLYNALDYGASTALNDDFDIFFSDPVSALKVDGLNSLAAGLADAFLKDVNAVGGGVQFLAEAPNGLAPTNIGVNPDRNWLALDFPFPFTLRAGQLRSVPEPSAMVGLLVLGTLGVFLRRQQARL